MRKGAVAGINNSPSVGGPARNVSTLLRGTPRHRSSFPKGTTMLWVRFIPELNGRFEGLLYTWCVSWS